MNSPTIYRVVAVRANGGESIVAHHLSVEAAQRIVRMIRLGSPLQEIRIESEQDGSPKCNRGLDEKTRRILKEMKARRFRVVVIRPDGSRVIIGKGLSPSDALLLQIRLILEHGLSNVLKELETSAPYLKSYFKT